MGHRNQPSTDAQSWPWTQGAAISLLAWFPGHFLIYNVITEQFLQAEPKPRHHVRSSGGFSPRESGHFMVQTGTKLKAKGSQLYHIQRFKTCACHHQGIILGPHSQSMCWEWDFPTMDNVSDNVCPSPHQSLVRNSQLEETHPRHRLGGFVNQ